MYKLSVILSLLIIIGCKEAQKMENQVPKAKKIKKELVHHGDTRVDNYYWMNERDHPDVIDYLNAENDYVAKEMAFTDDFQKDLYEEMRGRIQEDDQSVPYKKKGYWYYTNYEKGMQYAQYFRKKGSLDADPELLIDGNERAKDHDYYALGGMAIATNLNLLAFSEDVVSRRQYTIRFKDLSTGALLEDEIPNTTGGITWANDNQTVFYTKKDETTLRAFQIYKHKLGTPVSDDVLVFEEKDETFNCGVYKSKSEAYIIIYSSATLSNEYQILDAHQPDGTFKMFQKRERFLEYSIAHFEDRFFIRTNKDGATNFKLMVCPENQTEQAHWKDVFAYDESQYFEDFNIFTDYVIIDQKYQGLNHLKVYNAHDMSFLYEIEMPESAYSVYIGNNPDFDSKTFRYVYTSLTTPSSVIDFDLVSKERTIKKEQEVLGDFDKANYRSEKLWITARDGQKVGVSLVYHKDTKIDGTAPLLLYGYGSYGINIDPGFSSNRLSLLDRGFVFAIAHIRGSQHLGRAWYEDGKFLNKRNTFTDFIDCADALVEQNYAAPDKVCAMGGSAGGLLMGAVINMRPDRWKAVVAAVPFVDVVTTMLDESIPLTTGEFDEWGNPKDVVYYEYMKSYSPYDNVVDQSYPHLLVTTGYHDSQVQYWEPAKWVAKLREHQKGSGKIYFKTNMDTGHGGASGRFDYLKEVALDYAFLIEFVNK